MLKLRIKTYGWDRAARCTRAVCRWQGEGGGSALDCTSIATTVNALGLRLVFISMRRDYMCTGLSLNLRAAIRAFKKAFIHIRVHRYCTNVKAQRRIEHLEFREMTEEQRSSEYQR